MLFSHRQRNLLSMSVRPKQIQLIRARFVRPYFPRAPVPDNKPSIVTGENMLADAVSMMESDSSSDYKGLMMEGLLMLKELAAHKDKLSAMRGARSSPRLLSMVMAPLSSDLQRNDHDAWSKLAAASLELMWLLVDDPSATDSEMKSEMSRKKEVIVTIMMGILNCDTCEQLHMRAKKILTHVRKI